MSLYVVTVLVLLFFAAAVGVVCFECGKRSVEQADFYEDDESFSDVIRAWESGEKGLTEG